MRGSPPIHVGGVAIDLSAVRILFFDVGNVFVSDDPSACYCYRCLYDALPADRRPSAEEYFHNRSAHVRAGGHLWSFVKSHIPDPEFTKFRNRVRAEIFSKWPELSPLIPGMAEAARELSQDYRLGIIANQPREIEPLLEQRGLLDLFEVRAVSESLGIDKPDPRIFEWALDEAKVTPQQALMIGDRIDNDIRPARAIGMSTLWLRLNADARGWKPADEFQEAFVRSMAEASVSDKEPGDDGDKPDLIANSPRELVSLLKRAR